MQIYYTQVVWDLLHTVCCATCFSTSLQPVEMVKYGLTETRRLDVACP